MKRPPASYTMLIVALAVFALLVALTVLGVPPFDNFKFFILSQVTAVLGLLFFGVIGGAFVGMIVAHRILANREFTPFERSVMESLSAIQSRLDTLEKRLEEEQRKR